MTKKRLYEYFKALPYDCSFESVSMRTLAAFYAEDVFDERQRKDGIYCVDRYVGVYVPGGRSRGGEDMIFSFKGLGQHDGVQLRDCIGMSDMINYLFVYDQWFELDGMFDVEKMVTMKIGGKSFVWMSKDFSNAEFLHTLDLGEVIEDGDSIFLLVGNEAYCFKNFLGHTTMKQVLKYRQIDFESVDPYKWLSSDSRYVLDGERIDMPLLDHLRKIAKSLGATEME